MQPLDLFFLAYLFVFLPYAAVRGVRRVRKGTVAIPPTGKRQQGTLAMMAMIFLLAYMTARGNGLALGIRPRNVATALPWTLLFAAVCAGWLVTRWRAPRAPSDAVLTPEKLAPHGTKEGIIWIVTSCTAGVVEEYVYRGVGTTLLAWYAGGLLPASIICAGAFGIVHAAQGKRGMLVTFLFALGAQALIYATGALGPAMLVHALYDMAAGWVLAKKYPRAAPEVLCV
ncbi:MAG: type II CAAX endopeptidase family protein [Gemmatimonadota bacterium]